MTTDSQIQTEVIAKLKWEPGVDATSIGVEVRDGIVTLSGQVNTFGSKYAAERAAQSVDGVKALVVEIDVVLHGRGDHTDAEVARAVELALHAIHGSAIATVKIMVEGGCVTLSGKVESEHLRRTVADTVSRVTKVSGVRERMTLEAPRSPAVLAGDIAAALQRRCGVDTDDVAVQLL